MSRNKATKAFLTVFGDEPTPQNPAPTNEGGEGDKGGKPSETYTKEQVEKLVQERINAQKLASEKMIKEVEALKTKAGMTEKERNDLQAKIQALEESHMSKEEIAKRQIEKLNAEKADKERKLTEERDAWQKRYTDSTIDTSIINAASKNDAYNSTQIQAILRPYTTLLDEMGKDGEPTGKLIPKVYLPDVDDKGTPFKHDLTVEQAVKHLKERDEYKNLFRDTSVGGLGNQNVNRSGKRKTAAEYAKEGPEAYRKAKAEGLI